MNRTIASLAAAAVALTTAAPAFAADGDPAPSVAAPRAAPAAKTQRYCFPEVQYGAIVRKNVCDTRAGWQRNGVDPLNFLRK
jgi:hypothetical protein